LGYRQYAKDFEIEYVERPGRKRPKAVSIYVGPYFQLKASPERVRKLRRFYLGCLLVCTAALLIPMCIDCAFTRTWYIQTPLAAAWIPWALAAASVWRLWTAGEKVDREHYDLLHDRMSGSCLFLMGFAIVSVAGCVLRLSRTAPAANDLLICGCCLGAGICGVVLFSRRKELEMIQEENPEKPQAGR
jgi:hypothetical protein